MLLKEVNSKKINKTTWNYILTKQYVPIGKMQGGFHAIVSHGNILKNAILRHVRVVSPAMRSLMLARHESTSAAQMEEHGFESATISDILKAKGKGADGSWLWCTTEDTVYDAVKSVCIFSALSLLLHC